MLIKPFMGLSNPDQAFPKADTCFFNLMLPQYSNAEILRERLLFAIHTDADSMDADTRPQDEDERVPASRFLEGDISGSL
jgi:other hect domain ubiquitin protein ligase E3